MQKLILFVIVILILSMSFVLFTHQKREISTLSPISKLIEKPLEKYAISRLGSQEFAPSEIVFDEAVATTSAYTSYVFHLMIEEKKVTGLAYVPAGAGPFPVIVQLRGYVNREAYTPGEGTRRSAEVYARNGFMSLAPDFLGYGGSDMPSSDVFEERFQTYIVALHVLASLSSIPKADTSRVSLWGHSNGGQIALTVLEILGQRGERYPATLWAPVTKPFPYSILYYTDDFDDHGKMLRKRLSEFESQYDAELYSLTNYMERIAAPIQIHQGTADDAVPVKWSDTFVDMLEEKGKDVTYYTYPGADHNMVGAWDTVVSRDIQFFRRHQ